MSTLNVSNISDGTDTVETGYVVNGSAKAWATLTFNFSTVLDSLNVSSGTDLGTANSRINYTNNLTGYPSASVAADASSQAPWFTVVDSVSTSSCSSVTFNINGGKQDGRIPYYIVMGDLA